MLYIHKFLTSQFIGTGSFVFLATAREVKSHVCNHACDLSVKMAGLGINGVDVTDVNELCRKIVSNQLVMPINVQVNNKRSQSASQQKEKEILIPRTQQSTVNLLTESTVSQTPQNSRKRSYSSNEIERKIRKTKFDEKEDEIDDTYKRLKAKHGDTYTDPQLKLWARMIANHLHSDMDDPPKVPMITGPPVKREPKKESLEQAIIGVANAVTKAVNQTSEESSVQRNARISPLRATDIRSKSYTQLRMVQQLYDDGILTESEFAEQKKNILDSLRKI